MDVEVVGKFLSTLPEDDDHPYRTGPWRPQTTEWRADDLTAVHGEIPADLDGLYLRNTENPLHPALKFYHPFDGDGMLHIVGFRDGKAFGTALTSFYQCGDLYRVDPYTGETQGKETWNGSFPHPWGVSAHPKVDERTGEMLFFNYSKQAPYLHYGVVDATNDLVHYVDIPLPGPRLPHDMAFTRNYAILNDFPLFWQPELLERNLHIPHFYSDMPSRFAVIPRRGSSTDITWFEADPTFVLHFTNAYEDGDEIVLDGFYQGDPNPLDDGAGDKWQRAFRFLALDRMQARLHRWRFNLKTGTTTEQPLSDTISEFGMINAGHGGEPYRYAYAATGKPGWFLFDGLVRHDVQTGNEQRISFGDGVYGSETAMAPRVGSRAEDDGYLVTLTTDMNDDASYCLVFDAARLEDGPVCKIQLPERISSGTHSTWVAGSELRRWRETDTAAAAVGL
jgi:carotenoid cleavage dioxygenase